ncbi:hypothetical protein A2154_05150 [Candidatus Gottesmanbacteria bacterium RBG_16_43_7]|uniref:Uncharacterized protein n=1 Tax=Candidatus Gottesmanbacteria bacterium RBG_16_43_7 TaxID=1798373 RepID=A0A1F5ZBY6_9BACT|nr:MAG: hypothetical protein A2154_05150 [Candidatus Gottesmanbacteria bacterium RBG_16_43_7]
MLEAEMPKECLDCIEQAMAGEWQKTPQEAINCLYISRVGEDQLPELPCYSVDTRIGGSGQFQNIPEALFNNRTDVFPSVFQATLVRR